MKKHNDCESNKVDNINPKNFVDSGKGGYPETREGFLSALESHISKRGDKDQVRIARK